jgi:hypothetical protein
MMPKLRDAWRQLDLNTSDYTYAAGVIFIGVGFSELHRGLGWIAAGVVLLLTTRPLRRFF